MLAGMYTTHPGHEVVYVWCNRCGHRAYVAPELWRRSRKRHCRECGSLDYEQRIIWHQGLSPDNVVVISAARQRQTTQTSTASPAEPQELPPTDKC